MKSIAVLYGRACRKLLSNCNTFFVKWGPVPCFRSPIARWICHASIDSVYYCARELPCLQVIILFILRIILSPSQSCMYSAPNQVPKLKKSKVIVFHKTRLQGLFSQIPIQRYSNISVCERKHNYYSPFHFYIRKVFIFQTKVSFNN